MLLNLMGFEIGEVAGLFAVPSRADEIVELAAMSPGAFREDHFASAARAMDGALQVVVVGAMPGTVVAVRGPHTLDAIKKLVRDKSGVGALVPDAPELDDPDVIWIPQELF
ncbi:MAG TPA: hypothetical protein VF081_09325 [Solirubrobacterales bacterium]